MGFLVAYGELVFVAILGASALAGGAAWWLWQARRLRARWTARVGADSRHDAHGSVTLSGRLDAHGATSAVLTLAVGASQLFETALVSHRAERLTLITHLGAVELEGPVHVVAGPRVPRGRAAALIGEAKAASPAHEREHLDRLRLEARELRGSEPVLAFGVLERVADHAQSYRASASRLVLRAADGYEGVTLAGVRRRRPLVGAIAGVALAVCVLAAMPAGREWSCPNAVSLIVPWERPAALHRLAEHLRERLRYSDVTRSEAELYLAHFALPTDLDRARALLVTGHAGAARRAAVRGESDPLVRAERLASIGLREEAVAEVRRVSGPEARAREVLARVDFPFVSERELATALDATCGARWTCAAHPRLLCSRAPDGPVDVGALLGGGYTLGHLRPELVAIMVRVAGDESVGDAQVARCRVRWLMELAVTQMRVGAVAESRASLARARRSIERWPGDNLDLARDAGHLELAAALFEHLDRSTTAPLAPEVAHDVPDCPLARWIALARDPESSSGAGLSSEVASAIAAVNVGTTPIAWDDPHRMAVAWIAPRIAPKHRAILAELIFAEMPRGGVQSLEQLFDLATGVRALRRLGLPSPALEARLEADRRRLYGW